MRSILIRIFFFFATWIVDKGENQVLGNVVVLLSIVWRCSTPILPFFLLKAEWLVFVKLVPCLQMELTLSIFFTVLWPLYRCGKSVKVTDTGKGKEFIYSANTSDKIRLIRVIPLTFFCIIIECSSYTGADKLLGCVWFCKQAFHQHMNRKLDPERMWS